MANAVAVHLRAARSRRTSTRSPSEFVLLDNTYCCGILSADGHQWSTTAYSHRLHGKELCRLPAQLSRRHGRRRAGRAGLFAGRIHLGQRAEAQARSIRNYGEFMRPAVRWRDPAGKGEPEFHGLLPHLEEGSRTK